MISIFVDGAYSPKRDQGGWAFVVVKNGEKVTHKFDSVKLNATNNRMEIQAVIEALRYLDTHNIKEANIYSDSMYVIGTMTLNWKKSKNVDLWLEIDKLKQNKSINWQHIKGHFGHKYNEECDMLAVHASQIIIKESEDNQLTL